MAKNYLERWVNAAGIKTFFITSGDGKPVILLHGSATGVSASHNWAKSMGAFAAAGFSVYAPEVVGYGRTDKPAWANNIEAKVKNIVDFMDALCLEEAYFVGNSMGGRLSLGIAADWPKRVKKMVLLGSAGLSLEQAPDAVKSVHERVMSPPSREKMRRLFEFLCYDASIITEEMIDERYELSLLPGAQEALESFMKGMIGQNGAVDLWDMESRVPSIKTPALVISGKYDKIVPTSLMERMVGLLPNARLEVIDKAGHWAQVEQPDRFHELAIGFFKEP